MWSDDRVQEFADAVAGEPGCARVTDLLLLREGRVVLARSSTGGAPRDLFSVTKTVLAILAGIAADQGLLDVDQPITEGQTAYHLLSMTRGAEVGGEFDLDNVAVRERNWAAAFARSPQRHPPGTRFIYDNGASQLLSQRLHEAVPRGLPAFADRHLFTPLGIPSPRWDADPSGVPAGPGHLHLTAHHLARVGQLLLDDGVVDGRRLLSSAWVTRMRRRHTKGGPPEGRDYGLGLWLEPNGSFFGAGWAGQLLYCRPSDRVVLVTLSDPGFDYGPPATDQLPPGWVAPLALARQLNLV